MKQTYNLKDVAMMAGVSLGTASKVINSIYVRPESRLRVEAAMKDLNYTPNAIARSLKANTTKTIGIMIPDISSPVVGKVLKGIEDTGRLYGYSILIYDTSLNEAVEEEALRTFAEKKVDGIIYSGNTVSESIAGQLKATNIPVVFVMTTYHDKAFSSVMIDNTEAAFTAVDYLCKHRHRKILMLAGERDDPNAGIPRLKGYEKALAGNHITIDHDLIIYGGYRLKRGYEDTKKAIRDKRFTAIFAVSDDVAIGSIKALTEAGLSVPSDISVMGFDGIDMISYITPSLTTISQPFYRLGVESTNIIINRIEKRKNNMDLLLPYELIVHDSVTYCKAELP